MATLLLLSLNNLWFCLIRIFLHTSWFISKCILCSRQTRVFSWNLCIMLIFIWRNRISWMPYDQITIFVLGKSWNFLFSSQYILLICSSICLSFIVISLFQVNERPDIFHVLLKNYGKYHLKLSADFLIFF